MYHMSHSQNIPIHLMGAGSEILGTPLNYKQAPMSILKGSFVSLILTEAHILVPREGFGEVSFKKESTADCGE